MSKPRNDDDELPVLGVTAQSVRAPPPPPEWALGSQDVEIPTLFFQGLGDSQTKLVHYTGSWGFTTKTDQHARVRGGMEAIRFPFVGPEIQEIVPRYPGQPAAASMSFFWHPLLFAGRTIADYTDALYDIRLIPCTYCTPAIPPTNLKPLGLSQRRPVLQMNRINLGQTGDIQSHRAKYDDMRHQGAREAQRKRMKTQRGDTYTEVDIQKTATDEEEDLEELSPEDDAVPQPCILYGVGRGAAATFNAVATQKYRDIKLVVLEGCFKSVRSAIKTQMGSFMTPLTEMTLSLMTAYNPGGLSPMGLVSSFPTDIPVAFVTSSDDKEVSMTDTMALVAALRAGGHEAVHQLILRKSRHPFYTVDNNQDRDAYTIWLHALYRLYDLPHVQKYAELGEVLLDETQQGAWFTIASAAAAIPTSHESVEDTENLKMKKGKEKIAEQS